MPEDWTDVSSAEERVRTIAESMSMARTVEWVAAQAETHEDTARGVLTEMVDDGELITWTGRRDECVYAVNEGRQLVDYLRKIGVETAEGILIPHGVVEDLEAGHPD